MTVEAGFCTRYTFLTSPYFIRLIFDLKSLSIYMLWDRVKLFRERVNSRGRVRILLFSQVGSMLLSGPSKGISLKSTRVLYLISLYSGVISLGYGSGDVNLESWSME